MQPELVLKAHAIARSSLTRSHRGRGKLSVIDLYKIEPAGRGDGAALGAVFRR
jgi:hypothetical protein